MMPVRSLSIAVILSLAACQSAPATGAKTAAKETSSGIDKAVLAPADDLNLRRTEIPPTLKALTEAYGSATTLTCNQIATEILALTAELGLDEDELRRQASDTRAEKAGREASEAALNVLEDVSTGFIPFRGVVRRVSGASAHEKRLRAAMLTGVKRRAYLKGIGELKGCAPPAAPLPPSPENNAPSSNAH